MQTEMTVRERFVRNRNIVSKSITTIIFAILLWYGKIQQLAGIPSQHYYFVVRHSFDSGLLFFIVLLGVFGLYVSFSKHHMIIGKIGFLIAGSGLYFAYAGLFFYRDLFFPRPPTLQTALVLAIAISFVLDCLAGDY